MAMSDDLISREEAIRLITQYNGVMGKSTAKRILIQMPSVQPTHTTPSNTLGALDCVDRAEAIKAVKFYEAFCDPYPRVIEALEELPSAQPEDWMERNKERILQAGMEGREIEFRIGGRLFAIREKAQ